MGITKYTVGACLLWRRTLQLLVTETDSNLDLGPRSTGGLSYPDCNLSVYMELIPEPVLENWSPINRAYESTWSKRSDRQASDSHISQVKAVLDVILHRDLQCQ